MIKKNRKYFSLFGILAATVSRKILSANCMIHSILVNITPKIIKLLLLKVLNQSSYIQQTNK